MLLTPYWKVPRTIGPGSPLSVNHAHTFIGECLPSCGRQRFDGVTSKSSHGSRTREPPLGSAGGFSSAAAAPLRGRTPAALSPRAGPAPPHASGTPPGDGHPPPLPPPDPRPPTNSGAAAPPAANATPVAVCQMSIRLTGGVNQVDR